jgi:hypothetical protein
MNRSLFVVPSKDMLFDLVKVLLSRRANLRSIVDLTKFFVHDDDDAKKGPHGHISDSTGFTFERPECIYLVEFLHYQQGQMFSRGH